MKKLSLIFLLLIFISSCAFGASSDTKDDNLGNRFGYTLSLRDSDRSNWLKFVVGSDLTADRTFTFYPGDANRSITLTESLTLNALPVGGLAVATSANALGSLAVGLTTQVLVGGGVGTVPVWATLNQAAVAGLTTASSPTFVTVKLSSLTDGYVPYHIADATGLANSPISTDGTNIGLGVTADASTSLWVGTTTIGAEQISGYFATTFSASGNPNSVYGILISPILNTSSTYTSTAVGLQISDFSVASPPAVSYLHGIRIDTLTAGELGNYQITLEDASSFYESSYTTGTQTGDLRFILPVTKGTSGQALVTDGATPTTTLSFSSMTHSLLSATHTDSTAASVVRGDIITGQGATPKWVRLAKGAQSKTLMMGESEPAWYDHGCNVIAYKKAGDSPDELSTWIANAVSAGCYKVYIPRGTYAITNSIQGANLIIEGEGTGGSDGASGTIIDGSGLSNTEDAIYVAKSHTRSPAIKDLYITMAGGGRDGIRFTGARHPVVNNVYILRPGRDGIHVEASASGEWTEQIYMVNVNIPSVNVGGTNYGAGRYGAAFIISNPDGYADFINNTVIVNSQIRGVNNYAIYFGGAASGQLDCWTCIGCGISTLNTADNSKPAVYFDNSATSMSYFSFINSQFEEVNTTQTSYTIDSSTATYPTYIVLDNSEGVNYSSGYIGSNAAKRARITFGAWSEWYGDTGNIILKLKSSDDANNPLSVLVGGTLTTFRGIGLGAANIASGKTLTVNKTMTLTSAGDSGVITLPNTTATIPATSDNLSVFAATTSAQLAGVLSDENATNGFVTNPMTGAGDMIVGGASGVIARLAAGATTKILVGGGAADPVWTTATGTGAPVRAGTPTLTTPVIGAATGTSLVLTSYLNVDNPSYSGLIGLLNPAAYETFIQSNTHIYLNSTDANGVLIWGNGGELGSGTGGTGYTERFSLSSTGIPTSAGLTGSGNGFLCVNSTGVFYRSATVCVAP